MIRKELSPVPGYVRVVFELPSSLWADRIYLAGDFNQWCQHDIRLQQTRSGVWQVAVDLPQGQTYEFRYLIDGQWRSDAQADGYADNSYGSQNSVIVAEVVASTLPVGETNLSQAVSRSSFKAMTPPVAPPAHALTDAA